MEGASFQARERTFWAMSYFSGYRQGREFEEIVKENKGEMTRHPSKQEQAQGLSSRLKDPGLHGSSL